MTRLTYGQAITQALREEMKRDEKVIILGEDIAKYGGAFQVTYGLIDEFGADRVIDTPISESGFVGAGLGLSLTGYRPVIDLMFADFITVAYDQIVNAIAKTCFNYIDGCPVPLVIRAPYGGGMNMGLHHSQCVEAWFANVPGLKIVMPSCPTDAKALLKASIRDDSPVVFLEHKALYGVKENVAAEETINPLGIAKVKRLGRDVTLVATGAMVNKALEAAKVLAAGGTECEVIDLQTLVPLDEETVLSSVRKTTRCIVIEEASLVGGFGGYVASLIGEKAFDDLDAPVMRVGAPHMPVPFHPQLEQWYIPNSEKIVQTVEMIYKP